ncbi:hypothetical protein LINPERHAP2_LOCUS30110 [Linum perenne]
MFCKTPSVGEAYVVLDVVKMVREFEGQVLVKSDCLEVVNALRDLQANWPWEHAAVLADILHILQRNPGISITHYRRTEVTKAHNIANQARLGTLLPNWMENI